MSGERSIFWRPWEGQGMEHLRLTFDEEEIVAHGDWCWALPQDPRPFGCATRSNAIRHWRTRKLELEVQ